MCTIGFCQGSAWHEHALRGDCRPWHQSWEGLPSLWWGHQSWYLRKGRHWGALFGTGEGTPLLPSLLQSKKYSLLKASLRLILLQWFVIRYQALTITYASYIIQTKFTRDYSDAQQRCSCEKGRPRLHDRCLSSIPLTKLELTKCKHPTVLVTPRSVLSWESQLHSKLVNFVPWSHVLGRTKSCGRKSWSERYPGYVGLAWAYALPRLLAPLHIILLGGPAQCFPWHHRLRWHLDRYEWSLKFLLWRGVPSTGFRAQNAKPFLRQYNAAWEACCQICSRYSLPKSKMHMTKLAIQTGNWTPGWSCAQGDPCYAHLPLSMRKV